MVAICGDVLHSRVARSNIHLLTTMGSRVRVIGPPTLIPAAAANARRRGVPRHGGRARRRRRGDDAAPAARADGRAAWSPASASISASSAWTAPSWRRAKPDALVMHPGPMNRGVEIDSAVADDPRAQRDRRRRSRWASPCAWRCWTCCRAGTRAMRLTCLLIENVRLIDPATGLDQHGGAAVPRRADRRPGHGARPPGRRRRRSTATARSSAPAWSTCAQAWASPATNTARPSPPPPRPPRRAGSRPSPRCPTAARRSTTRRWSGSCAAGARRPARSPSCPTPP